MAQLLIVAHAPLASALASVARHAFPDCGALLRAVDVQAADSPEAVEARVRQAMGPGDVLILADTFGATPSNGALRVLPGSHCQGKLSDEEAARLTTTGQPFFCPVSKGGVLLMRPLLLHASSPAENPSHRRVIHIEYATQRLPNGLQWFGNNLESNLAFVALGSNLGNSRQIFAQAIARLQEFSAAPLRVSTFLETAPVDCPPGSPDFLNAIVALAPRAEETPESLHAKLQALEKEFGRQPKLVLNEPRPLDLDLIVFGQETRATDQLALPHPRAQQRRFVLQPLAEIAPDLILPGQARTVALLLAEL